MAKFKHIDEMLKAQQATTPCNIPGCLAAGDHRAPLSRRSGNQYQWLCVDHVREFNKQWDYFQGMSQDEIEAFQKDATFGHRPTWKINQGDKLTPQKLGDALNRFMGADVTSEHAVKKLNAKDKKALADLDLSHPIEQADIKAQYKKLVKRYHPDRNPNNKMAEEKFKQVTASYHYLIQHYCKSI